MNILKLHQMNLQYTIANNFPEQTQPQQQYKYKKIHNDCMGDYLQFCMYRYHNAVPFT